MHKFNWDHTLMEGGGGVKVNFLVRWCENFGKTQEGGRGHWTGIYYSSQSFIIRWLYPLGTIVY